MTHVENYQSENRQYFCRAFENITSPCSQHINKIFYTYSISKQVETVHILSIYNEYSIQTTTVSKPLTRIVIVESTGRFH